MLSIESFGPSAPESVSLSNFANIVVWSPFEKVILHGGVGFCAESACIGPLI